MNKYLGQGSFQINERNSLGINCNNVPIKGPDSVPHYNPLTDNGGCFLTKQLKNNCYAYGNFIKYHHYHIFFSFKVLILLRILIHNQVKKHKLIF